MSSKLLTGQKIVTDSGYTMMKFSVEAEYPTVPQTPWVPGNPSMGSNLKTSQVAKESIQNDLVRKAKKWCRSSCQGSWGFSETQQVHERLKKNRYGLVKQTYFAFEDDEDRLAMYMKFGDTAKIVTTWGSSLTFTIYKNG